MKISKITITSILFVFVIFFMGVDTANAGPTLKDALGFTRDVASGAGVEESSLAGVVGNVIRIALSVVGLLFFILIFYGGYIWMTARGEEAQVNKGKKSVIAAIIGLVIVLLSYAITNILGNII
jgi:hypothetical protein